MFSLFLYDLRTALLRPRTSAIVTYFHFHGKCKDKVILMYFFHVYVIIGKYSRKGVNMREKKELIRYGAICVAVLYLLFHYWDNAAHGLSALIRAVKPLLLGGAAAYILNMILCFYEKTILKKWKKSASSMRAVSILLLSLIHI